MLSFDDEESAENVRTAKQLLLLAVLGITADAVGTMAHHWMGASRDTIAINACCGIADTRPAIERLIAAAAFAFVGNDYAATIRFADSFIMMMSYYVRNYTTR